jgi:hypothetical protein
MADEVSALEAENADLRQQIEAAKAAGREAEVERASEIRATKLKQENKRLKDILAQAVAAAGGQPVTPVAPVVEVAPEPTPATEVADAEAEDDN